MIENALALLIMAGSLCLVALAIFLLSLASKTIKDRRR
jgi:hypothetical protein